MTLRRYERYKDSGIEWLGPVPAHWEVLPIKRLLLSIEQGWSPQCENFPANPGQWGVLKVGCVNGGNFNGQAIKTALENKIRTYYGVVATYEQPFRAKDNIAKALGVSRSLAESGDLQAAGELRRAVQQAFLDGAHVALKVAAGLVLIAAVVMYRRLPDTGEHSAPSY